MLNFNRESILKYLSPDLKLNINFLKTVDSTNSYLKQSAKMGAKEGEVLVADSQTGGRGRYDRKFYSPKGTGIYMSLVLKPDLKAEESVLITAAAAVAVREAVLAVCDKDLQIKWVNDLILDGKKVCGILTEGALNAENGGFNWAVLGIGLNVYEPQNEFPQEIKYIAGALERERKSDLRSRLCAEILNRFFLYYKELSKRTFIDNYREKSAVINKKVNVIKGDCILPATALYIDNDCKLLVEYENGDREYLSSGEISIKIN